MRATPPGPNGLPLVGNTQQFARNPFRFMTACRQAYGDVIQFRLGTDDQFLITNPTDIERVLISESEKYDKPSFDTSLYELLGDGLLLGNGDQWATQRRRAQPAFRMSRIVSFADSIGAHAEELLEDWSDGDVVAIDEEMARVTVSVILDLMFGVSIPDDTVRTLQENLQPIGERFTPGLSNYLLPNWAPTEENRAFENALDTLNNTLDDIIDQRRGTEYGEDDEDPPMDFLSIMLRAQNDADVGDDRLRTELTTILLAGHDTTALALTYAWYLLAQNASAETRFHEEITTVVGNATPTMAHISELTYTERVLNESMRLYPPVYGLARTPKIDVRLGGYRIPEGSVIVLPQWAVHRDPRWYDDPDAFDPDRWQPDRARDRPTYAYFPFGAGERICIGKHLAMLEAQMIMAAVGRDYSLELVSDADLDFLPSLTMHPEDPVEMGVHER